MSDEICPVCCGTKRLVEIACPPDCPYLASSRAHPAAVVARQRKRDIEFAVGLLQKLPDQAYRLMIVFQQVVRRYRQAAIPPLIDKEVADAASTLAATLETAERGIIYEHQAASITSQRLVGEFKEALLTIERSAGSVLERDAAAALRTLERGARTAARSLDGGEIAFLGFIDRLPEAAATPDSHEGSPILSTEGDQTPAPGPDGPLIILP